MKYFWTTLLLFFWTSSLPLQAEPSPALYQYQGTLTQLPERNNGTGQEVKRFTIKALVDSVSDQKQTVRYLVDENGSGGLHWTQRIGKFEYDPEKHAVAGLPVRLLNLLEEMEYFVNLRPFWFQYPENLREENSWEENQNQYSVEKKTVRDGNTFWKVHMHHRLGRHQDLTINQESNLVTKVRQTVFMGQGVEFYLDWNLVSQTDLTSTDWSKEIAAWNQLHELRNQLEVNLEEPIEQLTSEQLETIKSALPELQENTRDTLFTSLVRNIRSETRYQQERSQKLMSLSEKQIGQSAPALNLLSLKNKKIEQSEYKHKLIVLHFWKYHKEALKAPYGQVGYLDFLYNKQENADVKVYGVAVSSGLNQPEQKRSTLLKIRKMIQFMNLSYPITYDDGSLLKAFGDPEQSGGELPLWVVIDPQGKVAHYHTGLFEVKPNEGLKELDQILAGLRKESDSSKSN